MAWVRFGYASLFTLLAACLAGAGDWPTYRHDAARSGATDEALPLPLHLHWRYRSPAPPRLSWAGPEQRVIEGHKLRHRVNFDDALHVAVVGNRLYFGSSVDHQMRCIEVDSGKQLWTFYTDAPIRLAPTVKDGAVFFGSDDGFVYCLDAVSGSLRWKFRASPADERILGRGEMISRWPVRTGVVVLDGVVYVGSGLFPHEDVFLYALDANTGNVVWKRDDISAEDAGRNALSPQGYLLADADFLFVPSGRMLPACFDRKTGRLVHHRTVSWRREGVVGGTRAVLADGQLYAGGAEEILALDRKTGRVGFAYLPGRYMAVSGEELFLADDGSITCAHRRTFAKASTQYHRLKTTLANLFRRLQREKKNKDKLKKEYKSLAKKTATVKSAGVKWTTPVPGATAIIATKNLVVVGTKNEVLALDRSTGKVIWRAPVEGTARGLAAANGRLVVSTTTGAIYVYGAGKREQVVQLPSRTSENPYRNPDPKISQAAEDILRSTGVRKGYCLIVGAEEGRLAYELARRSELRIYGVEPDRKKVATARQRLAEAGLYGHRVVIHRIDPNDIPYSNYFANLVVSEYAIRTGRIPAEAARILRHVKPLGGVVCLPATVRKGESWLSAMAFKEPGKVDTAGSLRMYVRGKLRGAGSWSHQYGDPGNTACSMDYRVKGGLGVLWYGDPGPGKMVNRHEGAVGPLSVEGRLIVQGQFSVMAYDAYNGMFLWEYQNPKTYRTGVFQNYNPGNLVAGGGSVFIMEGKHVTELDLATGKLKRLHLLPKDKRQTHEWTFIAYQDGYLVGAASLRKELASFLRRRGRRFQDSTDSVFAVNLKTGETAWVFKGKNISASTIALGPDRVYLVESTISHEEREALLRKWAEKVKSLKGAEAKRMEKRMKRFDARTAIALELRSGKQVWSAPVDVTDCSEIGIGGGKLTLMYKDDVLVLCGANANGHYWRQFTAGEFKERRLVALSAKDGKLLWARDANYRHRPIIVEAKVIAEPWAFDLYTGKQIMRKNPITGEEVPWSIYRPGHHCGMLTASPNMLMFRSGYTGFYDLYADDGTRHFAGHRLGCWINAIPANGLVMIPEASAGCVCQFSIASTITLEPRQPRRPWTIYSLVGTVTPVERMAVNLGAPGDRKDSRATIWLAYPRPNPLRAAGLELRLNLHEAFLGNRRNYEDVNDQLTPIQSEAAPPWVFASWAKGLTRLSVPVRGEKDGPAVYTVRLFFAELDKEVQPGQRVFDVKLNGKTVLERFDIIAAAKSPNRGIVREIPNVRIDRDLRIELVPRTDIRTSRRVPILNGFEIVRQPQ